MKAKELLKQVLENGNTEQQGISIVGPFESRGSFIKRWFGEYVSSIGNIQNNKKYLFFYNKKELKDVADAIIKTKDDTIYLCLIEDEEENNTNMKTINLTEEQIKVLKKVVDKCYEEELTTFDRLFMKGEYIKSEKYAERANILEDIYNELAEWG